MTASQLFDLTGKIALVTGASRGIGRAIALRLAESGAAVAVNYHNPGSLELGRDNIADVEQVVSAITAAGGRAMPVEADVSNQSSVEAMVANTVASFGALDILVNNAGMRNSTNRRSQSSPIQLQRRAVEVSDTLRDFMRHLLA